LLAEIVKRKFINEEDVAYILKQVLSAMVLCHSRGIVHKNLKLENILIESITTTGKINVKVIGFWDKENGAPYYLAPEVLVKSYNEKCDVWSIGVIMFLLLGGCVPFNGRDDEEIKENIKKGVYEFEGKFFITLRRSME